MSPRSSKGKKSKAAKKSAGSANKAPMDVYTGLLLAGFLAVVTGCVLLAVELSKYEWTAAT